MMENSLVTAKEQKGYAEEVIILDGTQDMFKYSLSNSLEGIKIAIYERTGHTVSFDNTSWKINSQLSINVKQLMNKHHADYSMTVLSNGKWRKIIINMRHGDIWFITGFEEIKGSFYTWEQRFIYRTVKRLVRIFRPNG